MPHCCLLLDRVYSCGESANHSGIWRRNRPRDNGADLASTRCSRRPDWDRNDRDWRASLHEWKYCWDSRGLLGVASANKSVSEITNHHAARRHLASLDQCCLHNESASLTVGLLDLNFKARVSGRAWDGSTRTASSHHQSRAASENLFGQKRERCSHFGVLACSRAGAVLVLNEEKRKRKIERKTLNVVVQLRLLLI